MRTAPDYIQVYPTLRCNRICDFCFNRSLAGMDDMSLAAYRAMLGVLKPLGVKTIDIIGGEPTLHPLLLQLISETNGKGLHVNLSSNGMNIRILEEITKLGKTAIIGISINDHETLNGLKRFIESKRPVVKTIFSRALDHALIDDIISLKPERFYLIYRDAFSRPDLDATISFPRYLNEITTRFHGSQVGTVFCSGFLPDAAYPELLSVRCPAGTTKLGIMPDGSAYPCNLFFGNTGFVLGNILHDPFEAIWNHPALAFFRTYTGNTCPDRSCRIHAECHGGCPAQSLLLAGDLSTPDPRCIKPMVSANV